MPIRLSPASSMAVALALLASATPVLAQSGAAGLPYDARRGVFSFSSGLEGSLPAVVQVTTLGQSRGPSSDAADPKPYASGSGVIVDAASKANSKSSSSASISRKPARTIWWSSTIAILSMAFSLRKSEWR